MTEKHQVTVEMVSPNDIEDVVSLANRTSQLWLLNEPDYYTHDQLLGLVESENDIFLAAKVDGQFAGFRLANYNPILEEAYLNDLAIAEEFRGLGVASLLYQKTFEILKAKGCQIVWAIVHEDNHAMESFMEKQGLSRGRRFTVYTKILK